MAELYPPFEVEEEKEKIAREFQINSRKVLKLIYSYQFIRLRITILESFLFFDIFYTMSATLNYFLKLLMNIVHRTYFATLFIIWPFGLNGLIYDDGEAISVK